MGKSNAAARGRVLLAAIVAAAGLVLALSMTPSARAAAPGMALGLYDGDFTSPSADTRDTALDRSVQAGAEYVLIYVNWSNVAPGVRPLGFNAANPADPNYNWSNVDAAVRDAANRGLKVLISFVYAPSWAEGPNRPSVADSPTGTWEPNPADVGDFAHALASRYSGTFAGLPAVRHWQLWAEPNLGVNLDPQFVGNQATGPDVYRPMLNAFYANIKAVSPSNVVITGGTAPYGNLTRGGGLAYQRMQPLTFWKGLLCYSTGVNRKKHRKKQKHKGRQAVAAAKSGKLIPEPCPNPAHFDVAAHHPINVGAPTRSALNPEDISTPDLYKLKRVLRAAAASGRLAPGGAKPIWATEIWWNSNPPGRGLPLAKQARYLEQGFYVLWKQGVGATFWFEVRDLQQDGVNPIPTSGLFFRNGTPKPALQAYQFPFVTERLSRSRVRAWGEAPHGGPVDIQIRGHHLKTLQAGDNRVFVGILHLGRKANLRAVQGNQSSLVWHQG
jgi:hypothetical protein